MNLNESNVNNTIDAVENPSASKSPNKSNNYFQMSSKNSPNNRSSTQLKDPLIIRQEKYFLKLALQNEK